MVGVLGARGLPSILGWPSQLTYGSLYHTMDKLHMDIVLFNSVINDYEKVLAVDGFIMATQYDIDWREDLFKGWHFYDISQSLEFKKAGYEVGVVKQKTPWVIHDCGPLSTAGYEESRQIFLYTYKDFLNKYKL
jgi:hypothetical protein